jgi:hypothetical protein
VSLAFSHKEMPMRLTLGMLLALTALGCGLAADERSARADDKAKGAVVEIDGLKSISPAGWKEEAPSNKLRFGQFKIPRAQGDDRDAEMIIFFFGPGAGGGTDENVKRWKGMFELPEGKKADEFGKVDKFKVGEVPVTLLDVQGTYLEKFPPFDPNAKTIRRPDHRLLGVVFESPKGPYFFRLVGPAKTVTANKQGFEDLIKGFK